MERCDVASRQRRRHSTASDELLEVASSLVEQVSLPDVAALAVAAVPRLVPSDRCALWLLRPDGAAYMLLAQSGADLEPSTPSGERATVDRATFAGLNAAGRSPGERSPHRTDEPMAEGRGEAEPGGRLSAPIRAHGVTIAVLTTFTRRRSAYAVAHRRVLTHLASHVAAALERIEAVQRERERRRQAEMLLTSGAELSRERALSPLLGLIPRRAAELARTSVGAILLRDEVTDVLVPTAWHGVAVDGEDAQARALVDAATYAAEHHQSIAADGSNQQPHAWRGVLAVPIFTQGRLVGVVAVGHNGEREPFGQQEHDLLQGFATQAGIAIEHARFLERAATARAAREIARLKTEFLSTVSHELRTPLSLIHGYAELLMHRGESLTLDDLRQMSGEIYANSRTLAQLVNDLLDFSRLERGQAPLQRQVIDVGVLLRGVVDAVRGQPGGARVAIDARPALFVDGDPERLRQAVSNLLANALAYAPSGPIMLRAEQTAGVIRIEVEDRGPGVPPEDLARVWESFYRGVAATHQHTRGAGLGLAVVKRLVELHGGQVGVSSTQGVGTLFWLSLPLWVFPPPDPAPLRRQSADDASPHPVDSASTPSHSAGAGSLYAESSVRRIDETPNGADDCACEAGAEGILAHDETPG
ncbi:MAG: GAF domain-containing protein [Chloroflexi bacterium]|nr:GAF domain-containing protein [Chloroflexota bacterium]